MSKHIDLGYCERAFWELQGQTFGFQCREELFKLFEMTISVLAPQPNVIGNVRTCRYMPLISS